jgi:4-methyl-5(b-hydroxyethyl)-thiazole monophosphate biosynthesis
VDASRTATRLTTVFSQKTIGNANAGCFTGKMPSVLVLLAEGFEEIEAIAPIDLLRRAGAEVVVASLAEGIHVTGRNGVTIHADVALSAVESRVFDCVLLPGGPGTKNLRSDPRVRQLVQKQADAGRWLAAICAAPTVLHDAGLLGGKRFTAHSSVQAELPATLGAERTVIDGKLLTSRGAGTALEFGLMLVERLFTPEKRDEIARSIGH